VTNDIGRINTVDNLDKNGNGDLNVSDWDFLKDFFDKTVDKVLSMRNQKTFSLNAILK